MGITCQFQSDSLAMPAMDIWLVIWARYIKYILHPETDHDLMWPMTITYGISVNEECLLVLNAVKGISRDKDIY